ncbi:MAG: hypothetical protein RIT46_782 [Pseudomonadota bacterium]|jgi:uncharacterized membrane protein
MIIKAGKRPVTPILISLGLLALFLIVAALIGLPNAIGLHAPRLDLLAQQPLKVQIHIAAALLAFSLGLVLFAAPKGTLPHRTLGWIWVVFMTTVAASSLFMTGLNGDAYSWIHMLSGYVLISLPAGVIAARRHKVLVHQRTMTGLFLGGMVIAGAFTFLPGRLMWRVIMG